MGSLYKISLLLSSLLVISPIVLAQETTTPAMDLSSWADYATSVKNCVPGKFHLLDPLPITALKQVSQAGAATDSIINDAIEHAKMTYQIMGWDGATCHVIVEHVASGNNTVQSDCAIPADKLPDIAQYAQKISTGDMKAPFDDSVPKIMAAVCKQTTISTEG